ncbi:uncharacterized protein LOC135170043 [Diachasmimorpha longicaudata]|uniref:uncharacterized protein LOC135170043 n=1 Tax=Diachasmimorpha longicaudata TaxID=58733 RepID=UPI0030B8B53B
MESVNLINCIQCIGTLIRYFIRIFSKLFLYIFVGAISQMASLLVLARIWVPVLLVGFISIGIIHSQFAVFCERPSNINQTLYKILEIHLLNLIHPPVMTNGSDTLNDNSIFRDEGRNERALLRIVMDGSFPDEGSPNAFAIPSGNPSIERLTSYSMTRHITNNDNADEIEQIVSLIEPDASLDSNHQPEVMNINRQNSEDIEALLSSFTSSQNSYDSP